MKSVLERRLEKLGYNDIYEYYLSDHWQELRGKYENTHLPHFCIACGDGNFLLFHRSTTRLGHECIRDVIPLCETCRDKVINYSKKNGTALWTVHKILRKIFGWSRKNTEEKFRPFNIKGFVWAPRKHNKDFSSKWR